MAVIVDPERKRFVAALTAALAKAQTENARLLTRLRQISTCTDSRCGSLCAACCRAAGLLDGERWYQYTRLTRAFLVVSLNMTIDRKPFVVVACLCEKVLTEPDGVMSLIRVVDQYQVAAPPAVVDRLNPHLMVTLVLNIKANGHVGTHEIAIQLVGQTKSEEPRKLMFEFPEGPLSAINVVTEVSIGEVKNYGEKRFDVFFDGEFLTSVPFRVLPSQAATTIEDAAQRK